MGCPLQEVAIPQSVEVIWHSAFANCGSLRFLAFAPGSRLRRIGESAFANTMLLRQNVRIPDGAFVPESAFPKKVGKWRRKAREQDH